MAKFPDTIYFLPTQKHVAILSVRHQKMFPKYK